MGLRETIAYNKDLITGQETSIKKYKRTDAPMINTATVELFDAETGKKIYEAKAENVVNSIISKMAYMDYFYHRIKGSVGNSVPNCYAPMQQLILTDYAGVESADTNAMYGKIIGYADKSSAYAGSETLRGTVNLAETKLDVDNDGLLHFVFDFPTHAGNGIFRTIWWNIDTTNKLNFFNSNVNLGNSVLHF